ncbi:putative transposase [Theobroma cacao]|nr:putative transposase [Theobroma cacao]
MKDYAKRHSRGEPFSPVGLAVDGATQIQQDRLGTNRPHPYLPPLSYSQPHQLQQPPPSTAWPQFSQLPPVSYHQPCQSQHNQPQFSQLQACTGCNSAGYSHFQPPKDVAPKHKKNASLGPAASIDGGTPSHSHSQQPQLSHNQPYGLQQQSINQPSQLQAVADGGHSHSLPQADYTRCSGYVPSCPVDPMVVVPSQSHPQQSSLSHGQSIEQQQLQPQASPCQPQSSPLQDNVDIDSALRGIRCAPTTNKSYLENQDQLGPIELQSEQTLQSQEQPHQMPQLPEKKKRGRGPTRCLFLNDLADGDRIFVHVNKLGQPVGPESAKLISFLGTIARNGHRAPLIFFHWRAMPYSYKEEMWEYVQTKFDLDPSCKSWVMQSLATKWRDWKAELKASYYDALNTDEERLKVRDPMVVPEQWPSLISYWNSDDTKKRCATNKANRAKQKGGHASGTKSYARIREEERNKRPDGKEPTRAELYILTHTRKNGQPVDETAAAFISKLRKQASEKQNNSQGSDESNDTFCQVMGEEKRNRVRTYGLGVTHTAVFGPRHSHDNLVRMASEAKKSANEEVRKMVVKMEAMEEKYALMETYIARMNSNMEKFLEKIGGSSKILGSEQAADAEDDA